MNALRPPALGRYGMVATSQTLATQAGIDILRSGGSAVDAALAANAMLALTEPHMCGPGGDLFALVWDPRERRLHGLNASGRSPRGQSFATLEARLEGRHTMPGRGPLAVTAPGAVDGWCKLHDRFGRLSLREIFAPAVEYAHAGFPVATRTSGAWRRVAAELAREPAIARQHAAFAATFLHEGEGPSPGQVMSNRGLARTLDAIAEGGRREFYAGEIGEAMLACLTAAGGAFTADDLTRDHAEWVEPLTTRYRGHDVYELPPNGQGVSVLQMLNILEHFPLARFGIGSAEWWHAFLEAKKLVFEDRARHYADPACMEVSCAALLDKDYAARRAAQIDPARAGSSYACGDVAVPGGDTTYLAVADQDGMMVSFIQSIFQAFGSGLVVPEGGFALQSRAAGFNLDAAHPNGYAPGKRPFHTIIPGFAMRDGEPWLAFGVMGADMQPQGQVQVLVNQIDFGLDVQAAGDAPRLRHVGGAQPNGERLDGLGVVQYEARIPASLVAALSARGHRLQPIVDEPLHVVGGYQAVERDAARGVWRGATESRFDGVALGY
ncbi:MAG: gamma-glutamyltransferase family protein [Gammaproteobacteria bacterium]|nr:gamma-glutamyltransferase family protein [Gammaproteobacteria bacterium]